MYMYMYVCMYNDFGIHLTMLFSLEVKTCMDKTVITHNNVWASTSSKCRFLCFNQTV